ncbi:hypothetical protein NUW58_g2515 [Xylaria curta]|uniref:Uncharacterized protein n=1 Tax=Xylaria curta TaxID=42375 RepID=A0ACC1PGI9_9PEZI|nr:hypothetical protein NUW58_g2515 [Xylaria curta]
MEQTYRVEKTPCQGPEPEQSSSSYSTEAPSVPSSPKSSLLSCLSYSSSSETPPSTLYETASENTPSSAKAAYRPQPSSSVATIPGDLNPRQAHSPEDHYWDAPPEAVVDGLAAEAQRQNLIAMIHLQQIYTLDWLYDSDKSEGQDKETTGEDAEQVSVTSKARRRAEEVHTEEERREQIRERRVIFRGRAAYRARGLGVQFLNASRDYTYARGIGA